MDPSPDPCSLSAPALADRVKAWQEATRNRSGIEQTPTGVTFSMPLSTGLTEKLTGLIEAEGSCCPSVTFDARVVLTVDGPADLRQWIVANFAA